MSGFLDAFRKKVVSSVWKDEAGSTAIGKKTIDDKIALGVLLWIVAEADSKFLPEEEARIKEIILSCAKVASEDLPLVLTSIQEAYRERIDVQRFTSEIGSSLSYSTKIAIIENLFRVACADRDLDNNELEAIRQISGLFHIGHKDFIDAKIKVKKEFGMDTAGL